MSSETFARPREATIQLSDVYGPLPIAVDAYTQLPASDSDAAPQLESRVTIPPPDDFDATITSQVRNTGRFHDGEHSISDGGAMLGGYGVVLVDELRTHQYEQASDILDELGVTSVEDLTKWQLAEVHPDAKIRLDAFDKTVVVIANSAPRTSEHNATGNNGTDFYVAVTDSGIEVYAQPHMLSSLDARGRIVDLYRIPEGAAWPKGEQFRSSVVSDIRRHPERLVPVPRDEHWPIPELPGGVQLAYVDKFANVRLQTADIRKDGELLGEVERVDLEIGEGQVCLRGIRVVSRMTDINEGEFGIYMNPADRNVYKGPAYLELIRRVSDPNGNTQPRAYHVLASEVSRLIGREVQLSDWNNLTMRLAPHTTQAA
jgi:hypothetical protein